ncbi:MAG TPA: hypothetical protein P5277_01555 [Candidatus Paceibacterota bacterium]|nr:hypothetical protein [Candidatus Paceibacterota bacterium]
MKTQTLNRYLERKQAGEVVRGSALAELLDSPEMEKEESKNELRDLNIPNDEKSACFSWLWTTHNYDSIKKLRELLGYKLTKENIWFKKNSTSIAKEYCKYLEYGYKKEAENIEECTGIRDLCINIADIGLHKSIQGSDEENY